MFAPARPLPPACRRRSAFTIAEMLVVMAIITVLAASLAVVLPRLRTSAMRRRAGADIQMIGFALEQYHDDMGHYPTAPYRLQNSSGSWYQTNAHADGVLFQALTNRHAGQDNVGWGGAKRDWDFIRSNNLAEYASNHDTGQWPHPNATGPRVCRGSHQILDPWGTPYYYIAHPDYLRGVHITDPTETNRVPNCYGATERPDDYRSAANHNDPPDGSGNALNYYGPPPKMNEFYNPTTFQIHSKGPDQRTDIDDGDETNIDACDRGTDGDDINNYGK